MNLLKIVFHEVGYSGYITDLILSMINFGITVILQRNTILIAHRKVYEHKLWHHVTSVLSHLFGHVHDPPVFKDVRSPN
jgi:hypothetical protein